jgi:hypothetical protein
MQVARRMPACVQPLWNLRTMKALRRKLPRRMSVMPPLFEKAAEGQNLHSKD